MKAILGIKKEMTQTFDEEGRVVSCTVIDVKNVVVVGKKSVEKGGYDAVVLGKGKKKNTNKPEAGIYKKLGYTPSSVKEFRGDFLKELSEGDKVGADMFTVGEKVVISGISKGKGFQGVVRRWGFHGGPKTHGQSDKHRSPGSIGSGTTPGRVWKGKRMAGRQGNDKVTVKNLKVLKVIPEQGLICVKGSLPGGRNSLLLIKSVG